MTRTSSDCIAGGAQVPPAFSNRAALLAKREELSRLIRDLEGGLAISQVSESMEDTVNRAGRETTVVQVRSTRDTLAAVNCALQRIALGVYGECDCGRPIGEKRLAAVPWATLCRSCAELKEMDREESWQTNS